MKRLKLDVTKRTILGKQVRKLRREGILPATIYGKGIKSVSVELPVKEFDKVFKEVKETGLIDVQLDGQVRPSLIHNVHIDPISGNYLHTDFYQVNLKEKIKSMIPVVTIGEPKAVVDKLGLLLQTLNEIEVEALPEELPENVEVNVENLAKVDDQILVSEIKSPKNVEILTDANQVVFKITELVSKEAEELAAAEAAAAEAAKAETAVQTGEVPAEGEAKAEEAPSGEQKPEGEAKKEEGKPEETPKG